MAGDRAVVTQIRDLLGPIGGGAVKAEINDAALGLSPKRASDEIRRGVTQAVRTRARAKRLVMPAPYTMALELLTIGLSARAQRVIRSGRDSLKPPTTIGRSALTMLGRVNRPRPTPPDPASLKQIVEHSVLLRVSQLLEKLVTEQRNIAAGGGLTLGILRA